MPATRNEQEAKYIQDGRTAARSFLNDGVPLRPPKGISYLQIARGYADLLVVSCLYKIEELVKKPGGVDPVILLDLLRQLSILQVRVRGKLSKRGRDQKPTAPQAHGSKPGDFQIPSGDKPPGDLAKKFDDELGVGSGDGVKEGDPLETEAPPIDGDIEE